MKYNPKKIESKWRNVWQKKRVYEPDLERAQKPFYNLMMFPYPSAEGLHIGSVRTFTGGDIYGRLKRMQGFDVFEPMGLDGFGIHSENYALKVGKHPMQHATDSQKNFYRQLESIGNGFAWNERLETYDPEYYKWTQWVFLQMFKRGLAYRKKSPVNWCPSCKTVLADEQVIAAAPIRGEPRPTIGRGKCERCGVVVVKRDLEQWFLKITEYAPRLLKNLEHIHWDEHIKIAQRNWIGKSEGTLIKFSITKKFNYVFLHGYKGSSEKDFWPWLKAELRKEGAEIYAPDLPNSADPDIQEQTDFVLRTHDFNENTIIIGHSLGCLVGLALIPKLRGKIAGFIAVAPPMKAEFLDGKKRPSLERVMAKFKLEAEPIRQKSGRVVVFKDIQDNIVPPSHPEELANKLGARLVEVVAHRPHFNCAEVPEILREASRAIEVFTTRPDTLFGATYVVVAPEHPLLVYGTLQIVNRKEVDEYIRSAKSKKEEDRIAEGKEKTGVQVKGVEAINPANKEKLPIFVADYVLDNVGTSAIMAVPAHDERDFEFAKKFGLGIRQVIEPMYTQTTEPGKVREGVPFDHRDAIIAVVKHWSEDKYIGLKWKEVAWGTFITGGIEAGQTPEESARVEIREETGFLHPKLISDFGIVHGNFYHVPKKTNRAAHARVLVFTLEDGAHEEVSQEEQNKHEVFWLTKEELQQFLTPDTHLWALTMLSGVQAYTGSGILTNSGEFSGTDSEGAKKKITEAVGGAWKATYRLRDWLISRQRYWGPPIPMIFCKTCAEARRGARRDMPGWYTITEKDLPLKLPNIKDFRPTGTDQSPLASVEKFYKVCCPECGAIARRETDVSDTFLDSAWYFLRYPSVRAGLVPWDPVITKRWLPVNMYIGGAEHSVLHLLYSRFVTMLFCDAGLLDFEEPFTTFRAHGLITKDGAKMSKSKGNVVSPDDYLRIYGIDAMRMYLAFLAPLDQGGDFRDEGIKGITRFLERVWNICEALAKKTPNKTDVENREALEREIHKTIKKVGEDIEALRFNTAISALMVLLNTFEASSEAVTEEDFKIFLKLLAPLAPFIAEDMYQALGKKKKFISIHRELWPHFDPTKIQNDTYELIVQVNGKVRGKTTLPRGATQEQAVSAARALENVHSFLKGETKKVIFVPDKIINFVV